MGGMEQEEDYVKYAARRPVSEVWIGMVPSLLNFYNVDKNIKEKLNMSGNGTRFLLTAKSISFSIHQYCELIRNATRVAPDTCRQ